VPLIIAQWIFKCGYEIVATPLTYAVVNSLKRAERVDYFDRGTNFNPFSASDRNTVHEQSN
jgi:queuosine precursor transporter